MIIKYNGLTLHCDQPHLGLEQQIRAALLAAKRKEAYVNAPAEELEEFARRAAKAIHLQQNGQRYRDHAASYTPKDTYGEVRQANSLASLKRQETEALEACKGFSWEQVEVTEAEVAEALAIFKAAINERRAAEGKPPLKGEKWNLK